MPPVLEPKEEDGVEPANNPSAAGRHVRPASELKRVVAPVPERLGLGPETAPVLTPPPFKASPLAVSRT